MPPIAFWTSWASSYITADGTIALLTPKAAQVADALLLTIIGQTAHAITAPDDWEQLATFAADVTVGLTAYLFRHLVTDTEPAQHVFATVAALSPQPIGIGFLLRGTDLGAELVAASGASVDPASLNSTAPSIALAAYSDLVVAFFYAKDAAGADVFTPPAGATQYGATAHGPAGSGGGSLAIAELRREAVGATGNMVGVWSVAALGLAGQWAIKSNAVQFAPSLVLDVPGAIGLPSVGV